MNCTFPLNPQIWDAPPYDSSKTCATYTTGRTYSYDSAGRLTTYEGSALTAGALRAHLSLPGSGYSADANGNLTQLDAKSLTWDPENRLVAISGAGIIDESYGYDPDGVRIKKGSSVESVYYINSRYEVQVASGSVVATKYYYFQGERVAMRQNSNPLMYLYSDYLGSTVYTTHDGGAFINEQGYWAYGRWRQGGAIPTDHKFTGQKLDGTGLYYFNARYYDPELGQFISPDTLVPDPSNLFDYNRYMYARGNPMKYTDPTGHCVNATTQQAGDLIDYDNQECWRLANTIANMWENTDYWSNRFTSKELFLDQVANNAHKGTDFFQAQMDFYLQSDAYRRQQPNLPASAASTGDPMCGTDPACKAVVQHALQVNQKCQEIDCIGIGNDVVGVLATGTVAVACVPGLAVCASIAAVAGPVATSSTLFGVGWSIYAWSNDKASNNDLTVTLLNAGAGIVTDRLAPGLYEAQTAYSLLQLIYDAAPRK